MFECVWGYRCVGMGVCVGGMGLGSGTLEDEYRIVHSRYRIKRGVE